MRLSSPRRINFIACFRWIHLSHPSLSDLSVLQWTMQWAVDTAPSGGSKVRFVRRAGRRNCGRGHGRMFERISKLVVKGLDKPCILRCAAEDVFVDKSLQARARVERECAVVDHASSCRVSWVADPPVSSCDVTRSWESRLMPVHESTCSVATRPSTSFQSNHPSVALLWPSLRSFSFLALLNHEHSLREMSFVSAADDWMVWFLQECLEVCDSCEQIGCYF